jgi:DNA-binding response OmpR family regulator
MTAPTSHAKILVVEDSEVQALEIRHVLEQEGYAVSRAASAEEALAMLNADVPDLIVADLNLPKMDGAELTRQVRMNARTRSVPVLMLTSEGGRENERAGLESGADAYVAKSRDSQALLLRVKALLRTGQTVHPQTGADFRQACIIVLDSSATFRLHAQDSLAKEGFRIIATPDPVEVLQQAKTDEACDCVIVNLMDVKFDGVDICAKLAASRAQNDTDEKAPFLIVGVGGKSEAGQDIVRAAFEAGADDVVASSTDIELLRLRLKALVRRKLAQEEARQLDAERRQAAAELAQTREALLQAQKMEAIGQLTGGIAHDFNNMLAGIIGGLNLLERRIKAKRFDETQRLIEAALTSANRAASLTSRLLAFGRRQSLDLAPVDVNASIQSMKVLLERSMGENVSLDLSAINDELWARTDAAQFESALLNLAINSRDAMPRGGVVSIETSLTTLGPDPAQESFAGDFVTVTVQDTGEGMTSEVLEKVFDPFFTTKPMGQGTGLGLSMVYGFIRQSGGRIKIDSTPGNGTAVSLILPATRRGEAKREPQQAATSGAGETVLVVEDDAQVRLLVMEVLKELGYRGLEAGDAQTALAQLEAAGRVDLIISDVGLPGLDGRRLAEHARERCPDVKVLFITGYAEHAAIRSEFLGPGMDMLTKPFAMEDLATKIRDMIAVAA